MILRLILTVLIAAFSGIGFAQAPESSIKPLQQSSASVSRQAPDPETRVFYEKYSSMCMIFAVDRSWFEITMYLFSTLDLNRCDEKRFAAMTCDRMRLKILSPGWCTCRCQHELVCFLIKERFYYRRTMVYDSS